jgi:Acetyltransferase (GNAT) domain
MATTPGMNLLPNLKRHRLGRMVITVSEEKVVDYELTARIATEAFGSLDVEFAADRMKWLYERGFGQGTIVVAAADDGLKIGQIALVHQTIHCDGKPCSAVQLVDLFIAKNHRSPHLTRRIYKEVEQICVDQNIRFILAMPNANARSLNARLLKLEPLLWLQIRIGVGLRPPSLPKLKFSGYLKSLTAEQAVDLLSGFSTPAAENGLRWDGEVLFNRLNDPTRDYAVHASADLVLISSSRKTRGVSYTLLCGFFARSPATATSGTVRELVRAACWFWKRPLYVYAGVNDRLARLPGIPLPARLRAPMLVQWRDLDSGNREMRFGRFQLIDSDFV